MTQFDIKRSTLLNLAGQALPLLVGAVAMPFVIRGLGSARFGVLSLSWIALGYAVLFDLGIARALTKYAAQEIAANQRARIAPWFWTALAMQTALAAIAALAVWFGAPALLPGLLRMPPDLMPEAVSVFQWVGLTIPALLAFNLARGLLEAGHRFDLVNAVRAPFGALIFGIPLVGVLGDLSLVPIVQLLAASRVMAALVMLALTAREFPELRVRHIEVALIRPLLQFGSWVSTSGAISPLLAYIDRFALGAIVGMTAVGLYSAPFDVVGRMVIVPASLVSALYPAFSALNATGAPVAVLVGRSVKYLLFALTPLAMVLIAFATEILTFWLGGAVAAHSATAVRILAFGVLVNSLATVPFTLLQAVTRPDLPAKLHLIELPIHLLWLFPLVRTYGITGAALAWTLRVLLDAILLFVVSNRVCQLRLFNLPTEKLPYGLAGGVACCLLGAGAGAWLNWPLRLLALLSIMLLAAMVAWRSLLAPEERTAMLGWFQPSAQDKPSKA